MYPFLSKVHCGHGDDHSHREQTRAGGFRERIRTSKVPKKASIGGGQCPKTKQTKHGRAFERQADAVHPTILPRDVGELLGILGRKSISLKE